ncbi:unnamed protein product, partial [Trichobilharzia regenti]
VVLLENGAWSQRLVLPVIEKASANQSSSNTPAEDTENNESTENTITAVIGYAYIPAYILIHHIANIRSGDIVLVHSAGGGVMCFVFSVWMSSGDTSSPESYYYFLGFDMETLSFNSSSPFHPILYCSLFSNSY